MLQCGSGLPDQMLGADTQQGDSVHNSAYVWQTYVVEFSTTDQHAQKFITKS
jgi:hypothetical protein